MANDVMAPLLLVPEFTTLYAIDLFDYCCSSDKTFTSQKSDIKNILINGNDDGSYPRSINEQYSDTRCTHYLESPSIIISESDDGTAWRLCFNYNKKIRNIVLYHHRNFLIFWPEEIKDISHVMMMGSFAWVGFIKKDCTILLQMLKERTIKPFCLYALHFLHSHFPVQLTILDGHDRDGTKIAMIKIDTMDNFENQIYGDPDDI